MYWEYVADNLVYSSFGLNDKKINKKLQSIYDINSSSSNMNMNNSSSSYTYNNTNSNSKDNANNDI